MARRCHLQRPAAALRFSSSSTWGRADQQASRDSMSLGRFVLCPCFASTCGSLCALLIISLGDQFRAQVRQTDIFARG